MLYFTPDLDHSRWFDADAWVAYVANEQAGSVTMYHVILNPINWLSNPAIDFDITGGLQRNERLRRDPVHPSNRFLYVSNRGHDSLTGFRIDKLTGRLTSLGQTPTEKHSAHSTLTHPGNSCSRPASPLGGWPATGSMGPQVN